MTFAEFERRAIKAGLVAVRCNPDHWQLRGPVKPVNFYPGRGTIYVSGQMRAMESGGAEEAIHVALFGPRMIGLAQVFRGKTGQKKKKLLQKDSHCHWCRVGLTQQTATVEHLVPLARGGSNRIDNLALACGSCNHTRGSDWKKPE